MLTLKRLLDKRFVSQAELAKALDRTEPEISRWVNGIRTPRLQTVRQIATELRAIPEKHRGKIFYVPVEEARK